MIRYTKSGVSQLLLRFITKKRDCTVAVPLSEALVLPLYPNKQHRSPRRYVRTRTHVSTSVYCENIHIPRTSKCCNVLDTFEFTRFQIAKHKALMTPLLCLVTAHPKDIIPRRGLITGAKVQIYFELCKCISYKTQKKRHSCERLCIPYYI